MNMSNLYHNVFAVVKVVVTITLWLGLIISLFNKDYEIVIVNALILIIVTLNEISEKMDSKNEDV